MEHDNPEALLAHLAAERGRRDSLRKSYRLVIDSRFHALRMLWFSIKALAGFKSPRDRYAVWSEGMHLGIASSTTGPAIPTSLEIAAPTQGQTQQTGAYPLIEAWERRMRERPLASTDPLVTVVIPAYNHLDMTVRCLQSIADTWFDALAVQIVVVDDGSRDDTSALIARLPGVDLLRNGANAGFVRGCNRGAALARGKYICFLNNDTIVRPAWLDHLVSTAENDADIGVVGSKLIYPDGRLQEAGAVIFRDANGWNYGRGDNPADPRYMFVRDVDYCSGAALLVRSNLFREIGGFAEVFAPAYYEDVDLCFAARERGYRVVYQPLSEVIHDEGVSSGTDTASGTKAYQERNRPIFRERWASALAHHRESDARNVPDAARRVRNEVILIVDTYVPLHDREAGSHRLMCIVRIMRKLGYTVMFLPDNFAPIQPYTTELQQLGVEVLHHIEDGRSPEASLNTILPFVDIAWICRPELFAKYEPLIRRNARTACIYDTIDLHFIRMRREHDVLGGDPSLWVAHKEKELALARRSDTVVVVTEDERTVLRGEGIQHIDVIPTLHDIEVIEPRPYERREGLLFIGNYNHTPNRDAVRWLCEEIMPLVWLRLPKLSLTLVGSNPDEEILQREAELIHVTGHVPDIEPYFQHARVFVGALRYGAGIKGKVGQALSHGLPSVLTTIAAEGFGVASERDCLMADTAQEMADAIVRLYENAELWYRLSEGGLRTIEPFSSSAVSDTLHTLLKNLTRRTFSAA
jgi:GT2 family glycosyltransferase